MIDHASNLHCHVFNRIYDFEQPKKNYCKKTTCLESIVYMSDYPLTQYMSWPKFAEALRTCQTAMVKSQKT
jgi:hypothetical protein